MNTAPPAARDLPPGRHAAIRAEVERATTARRPFRHAPVVTAAAVVALAVVLPLAPWPGRDAVDPAAGAPTASLADLAPHRVKEVEAGCAESAMTSRSAKLYQYREDVAGKYAILYTSDAAGSDTFGYLLPCAVDDRFAPFNSAKLTMTALGWLPGHFSLDHTEGRGGADSPGGEGSPAWRVAVGRVDAEVARVTYTYEGTTVEATVTDGTYLARIVYPDGHLPYSGPAGEVRAYDRNGRFLGTSADLGRQCYLRPDGAVVYGGQFSSDRATCVPATPWP
ncbi:hypothetical protein AB0I60_29955 [Actinosynnema sp. NPDC050436]|uniref:hypothetical protein n=1 Tax=Actinosynnema sp. NPDC050436 TaxID=3155659 RepID=UPI0033DF3C9E